MPSLGEVQALEHELESARHSRGTLGVWRQHLDRGRKCRHVLEDAHVVLCRKIGPGVDDFAVLEGSDDLAERLRRAVLPKGLQNGGLYELVDNLLVLALLE